MKYTYLIIVALCSIMFSAKAYSQKIEGYSSKNGVTVVQPESEKFGFKEDTEYALMLFTDGTKKEYIIAVGTEKNVAHNFPDKAKLLFKTADETVIALTALHSFVGEEKNKVNAAAFYPISKEQLESLTKGVIKVRLELLSIDKSGKAFVDAQEKEFKKDKIGEVLAKMENAIDLELQKRATEKEDAQKALTRSDSTDNF